MDSIDMKVFGEIIFLMERVHRLIQMETHTLDNFQLVLSKVKDVINGKMVLTNNTEESSKITRCVVQVI